MPMSAIALTLTALAVPAGTDDTPRHGDLLVLDRDEGAILAIDPASGSVRGVVTGPDLLTSEPDSSEDLLFGEGPGLQGFQPGLWSSNAFPLMVRTDESSETFLGVTRVLPHTGDRTPAHDPSGLFNGNGHLHADGAGGFYVTTFQFISGNGRVLRVDPSTGITQLVSGRQRGDGPLFRNPYAVDVMPDGDLLVAELSINADDGTGLFRVDPDTGNRTFVSRISLHPFMREFVADGVVIGDIELGDDEGGTGPVSNLQARDVVYDAGTVYVSFSLRTSPIPDPVDEPFLGGLFTVDLATGDRALALGSALIDNGAEDTLIQQLPPNDPSYLINMIMGLTPTGDGRFYFTQLFQPGEVGIFDPKTGSVVRLSNIDAQLDPSRRGMDSFCDLVIYEGSSCAADFDHDGDVDLGDFGAFGAAFNANRNEPSYDPQADFDGDGDVDLGDFGAFGSQFARDDCLD